MAIEDFEAIDAARFLRGQEVSKALDVIAGTTGIPRDDLKAFLLMRSYRASLPVILQRLTGRREMRVLRACTCGDPSAGINGDEAFLVLGTEYMEDSREDIRNQFIAFCETFMDGPVGSIYDDQCPECGALLTDVGNCPDTHCISNREESDENREG